MIKAGPSMIKAGPSMIKAGPSMIKAGPSLLPKNRGKKVRIEDLRIDAASTSEMRGQIRRKLAGYRTWLLLLSQKLVISRIDDEKTYKVVERLKTGSYRSKTRNFFP